MAKGKSINTISTFVLTFMGCTLMFGQTGGRSVFQFVNIAPSARISAIGGHCIAWPSSDPSAAYQNPALLSEKNHTQLNFNHQFYFADITTGNFSYSHHIKKFNLNSQLGVQYMNYGDIPKADVYGNNQGTFPAFESNVYLSVSRPLNERILVGANLQFISSVLDIAKSSGLSLNVGATYFNPDKSFGFTVLVKQIGSQVNPYNETYEKIPFEIQLGFAKRLKHLPFTFHATFQHLERWNLTYDDPDLNAGSVLFGEAPTKSAFEKELGNFFRHLVFGGELNVGKSENFSIRLGYNHLRNRDLNVAEYRSFSGISFGLGLKVYKFKIDYSYAKYHIAGGTNQFSLTTSLNSFLKRDL